MVIRAQVWQCGADHPTSQLNPRRLFTQIRTVFVLDAKNSENPCSGKWLKAAWFGLMSGIDAASLWRLAALNPLSIPPPTAADDGGDVTTVLAVGTTAAVLEGAPAGSIQWIPVA